MAAWGIAARIIFCLLLSAAAANAQPKRVLIVHSFGSVAPPFTTHSTAFEAELVKKLGNQIDLDEVSLDMARYAAPDMQEALVDYLEKRGTKWKPDLVVPIGGPAGLFVAKFRKRLFAETPVLYCSLDERLLGPEAFDENTALVGSRYEVAGFVDDILQIAPDTKNVAIVIGATEIERYWAAAFRREFEPFTNRINFIWLNELSFDQMLERVQSLPPHSYIFLILFLRDAAGVTQNADEALQRLHAVANAPINSIFTSQMGLGIVGGRLYPSTEDGIQAADTAVKILNGTPPSSLPHRIVPAGLPQYDWRELQRWKIDEKNLPANSNILFRAPTIWQQNRPWIVVGVSIFVAQALLISGLLFNLIRRRNVERSLAESETRFRAMADAAPVLVWMAGPDKLCTFFNKRWLDFTGRNMEQEIGDGWSEGVHADDFGKCLNTYATAFDTRKPFAMQYRLRNGDGDYRWVSDHGIPRYDAEGTFLGYVGACVDISDLLEKERALHEVEQRVALAAEAARLGVWELYPDTKEMWMSEKTRDLFDLDSESRIDYATFQKRIHPEDRAMHDESVQRAIRERGGYEVEYRTFLPNGSIRWIGGRAHCVSDPDGNLTRLVGVSMDITDRKQAEQLFQLAAEGAHIGIWDWYETTGELLWDGAMRKIFDLPAEGKMTLQRFYDAVYPHDLERVKKIWRHAVESRVPYQLEFRLQRPNGAIGWVDARGQGFYDDKGKPLRMIGIVVDITDRKLAEDEARRRREQVDLLSRVNLLGEMTGSLAHELNQPLTAIVSNANAGMRFIDRGNCDPVQMREIMSDVADDGRRANEIIRNVRNMIKRGEAMRGRVNLNDVVRNVSHMVHPDATANHCTVELTLADHLPNVECDPTQIQQVLINLVRNAFDAMRDTPPTTRTVQIVTSNGGDMIRVSVRDYGAGFPLDAHDQLFEQFFTTKNEGLGLGLAIVRSIIEAHGGKIGAENVDGGGGARFYFSLPATKETS